MATQLSAGVQIVETDVTNTVAPVATSVAAYVGKAVWGPPKKRTLVTDENEFVELFGEPTDDTYKDFFTVAGFLKFGNSMNFVRAIDSDTAKNSNLSAMFNGAYANASGGEYIDEWENYSPSFNAGEAIRFFAKYPGLLGDEIKVAVMNQSDWAAYVAAASAGSTTAVSGYYNYVEYGPEESTDLIVFVEAKNADNVYEVVEQFLVSKVKGTFDTLGNNIYVDDLINNSSKYIYAFNNILENVVTSFAGTLMDDGADGMPAAGDIIDGYNLFSNPEQIEINYLIGGANTSLASALPTTISGIAVARADCFSLHDIEFNSNGGGNNVLSPTKSDTDNNSAIIQYRNDTTLNTSYSAIYGNWFYIYDKYNDVNRWVPSSGYVAGIYALTADRNDAWFAPAGLNRGILSGVIKIAFNPNKSYRDKMYQAQVNPIVNFPGQGIVIWGQKTTLTKASAFDRVNVRLLFLYMEKAIGKSAKYVVFEQNDSLTRAVFVNMVKPFMEDIKGRRGVTDFLVDVGDKVNTAEVIDNNEFRANIFVKPTRAAEFIRINFIATKTGVDFSEVTV